MYGIYRQKSYISADPRGSNVCCSKVNRNYTECPHVVQKCNYYSQHCLKFSHDWHSEPVSTPVHNVHTHTQTYTGSLFLLQNRSHRFANCDVTLIVAGQTPVGTICASCKAQI